MVLTYPQLAKSGVPKGYVVVAGDRSLRVYYCYKKPFHLIMKFILGR